jgi:hypothetical protein
MPIFLLIGQFYTEVSYCPRVLGVKQKDAQEGREGRHLGEESA